MSLRRELRKGPRERGDCVVPELPLGDVGQPYDVAALVKFLLSHESRWITGQCINVDGGHSLRRGPQFTQFLGNFSDDELHGELP